MNLDIFLRSISLLMLVFFTGICVSYLFLFILSFVGLIRHQLHVKFATPKEILKAKITPPISIIAPAYNEGRGIVSSISSLLAIEYGEFEVILVNDGSKDDTMAIIEKEFELVKIARDYHPQIPTKPVKAIYRSRKYAHLVVVDKVNGGKADSINTGINASLYPLFCCIDADSILEKHALIQVVHPFMEAYSQTVAVGGLIRIANACDFRNDDGVKVNMSKKWLVNFQILEYFRAFLSGRIGLSNLNSLLIISGAFGLFKKEPVIQVGGYRTDIVGEDMELVVRLHKYMRAHKKPYRILFVPDPVCWTEAPETLKVLARQRNRWQRGLMESLFAHIEMFFNPKFGTVGMIGFPYFLFFEAFSPIIELIGYFVFVVSFAQGSIDLITFLAFLLLTMFFGMTLSLLTLFMEELAFRRYPKLVHLLVLIAAAVVENFGYRQYLGFVRLQGLIDWARGNKMWGEMERTGLALKS